MPDACRGALGYGEFSPRSDGSALRDYLYIDDGIEAYLEIAGYSENAQSRECGVWQAGTGIPTSVFEVVKLCFDSANNENGWMQVERSFAGKRTSGEISAQWVSAAKLTELTGWTPRTTLNAGITNSINWYASYFESRI